jgi:hypothetical protein
MQGMMERIGKFVVDDVGGAAAKGMRKINKGMQGALDSLKVTPSDSTLVQGSIDATTAMAKKKKQTEDALNYK